MRQLTEQQIQYIHESAKANFKKDWLDVRHEFVDHLSSSVEDQWSVDPNLSFQKAYNQAFDDLLQGQTLNDLIDIKKRTAHKSYFHQYCRFMVNPAEWKWLLIALLLSLVLTFGLISSSNASSDILSLQWGIMILWAIFHGVEWYKYKLTPYAKRQTIAYITYMELYSIDMLLLLPQIFLIQVDLSIYYIGLSGLLHFLLITFLIYRYVLLRNRVFSEIERLNNLELGLEQKGLV